MGDETLTTAEYARLGLAFTADQVREIARTSGVPYAGWCLRNAEARGVQLKEARAALIELQIAYYPECQR